jgi:hypothetical protein
MKATIKTLEDLGWKVQSCISYDIEHSYKATKGNIVYWGKSIEDLLYKITR